MRRSHSLQALDTQALFPWIQTLPQTQEHLHSPSLCQWWIMLREEWTGGHRRTMFSLPKGWGLTKWMLLFQTGTYCEMLTMLSPCLCYLYLKYQKFLILLKNVYLQQSIVFHCPSSCLSLFLTEASKWTFWSGVVLLTTGFWALRALLPCFTLETGLGKSDTQLLKMILA